MKNIGATTKNRRKYDQLMDDAKSTAATRMARRRAAGGRGGWYIHPPAAGGFGDWDDILSQFWHGRGFVFERFACLARFKSRSIVRKHNHRIALRRICGRQKRRYGWTTAKTVDFNLPAGVLAGDRQS